MFWSCLPACKEAVLAKCSYPQREGFCSSRDAHYLITKAYFPESNNINYWLKIRLALKFWESLILSCSRSMSCTWKRAMAINIAVTMTYYVVRIRLATLKWVNQQSRSPWYKDGKYTKNCVFIKVYLCLAEHYLHPVCSLFLYSCLRSSTGGMVDHVKLLWTHKNQYWHVTTLNNQKSITLSNIMLFL